MKKALLILFVAIASLTACKKESEDKLQGRWNLVKDHYVETLSGRVTDENTDTYKVGEMYIVFDGNNYKVYEDGDLDDSGTFIANENSITLKDQNGETTTGTLRWNSKSEFVLISEGTYAYSGQTYNYKNESTFQKH